MQFWDLYWVSLTVDLDLDHREHCSDAMRCIRVGCINTVRWGGDSGGDGGLAHVLHETTSLWYWCVFITAVPIRKLFRWGDLIVGDMC